MIVSWGKVVVGGLLIGIGISLASKLVDAGWKKAFPNV